MTGWSKHSSIYQCLQNHNMTLWMCCSKSLLVRLQKFHLSHPVSNLTQYGVGLQLSHHLPPCGEPNSHQAQISPLRVSSGEGNTTNLCLICVRFSEEWHMVAVWELHPILGQVMEREGDRWDFWGLTSKLTLWHVQIFMSWCCRHWSIEGTWNIQFLRYRRSPLFVVSLLFPKFC